MTERSICSCIAIVLFLAILEAGCAAESASDQGPPTGAVGQTSLELTSQTTSDVAGTYRTGSVAIRFEAQKSDVGSLWALYKSDGKEMFRVEQVGDSVVTTVLGSYRQRIDGAALAKLKAGQMDPTVLKAGAMADGDPSLLQTMEGLPEFAALPGLSQALGERGINGKTYPVTLSIHLLAERVQELHGHPTVPAVATASPASPASPVPPASTGASGLHTQGLIGGFPCYVSGAYTCCRINGSTACHLTPPPPAPLPCSAIYPYPDLRCDPNHDDCFGMCGPDCTCWESVCGDCQYHATCAQHDWFCQQVQNASYWDWLTNPAVLSFYATQCYGGVSALVAAVGCGGGAF